MEDTLRARLIFTFNTNVGLNPCFNGRYSQRLRYFMTCHEINVLILVLMEDTLRERKKEILENALQMS